MGSGISKLVFQPPDRTYDRDPNLIELHTAKNNVIPAFFVDREQEYTILFSHGNAEDLGMIIEYFKQVAEVLQVNVFAYEYSGYGTSTGSPSEENVLADVEAAFLYLRDIIGVPWERIILYGRSIGSGPSCHLASATPVQFSKNVLIDYTISFLINLVTLKYNLMDVQSFKLFYKFVYQPQFVQFKQVRGVILQSPVLSAYRVGFNLRFTLPGDMFPNIDKAPKIRAPTYVVHGTHDEIVPIWHGYAFKFDHFHFQF